MGNNTRNKKSKSNVNLPIKDNAAFQLFCGRDIVNKWHAPDHTKIEDFRYELKRNF